MSDFIHYVSSWSPWIFVVISVLAALASSVNSSLYRSARTRTKKETPGTLTVTFPTGTSEQKIAEILERYRENVGNTTPVIIVAKDDGKNLKNRPQNLKPRPPHKSGKDHSKRVSR